MPTDAFTELCAEMLSPLGPVRTRRMFGGQGLYVDGLFMALIFGGQLYLKADDTTRERFVAAGCAPFTYATKDGQRMVISYYSPPEETLESPPLMLPWARLAIEAALRAANAKAPKRAAKSTPKKSAAVAKRAVKSTARKSAAVAKRAAKSTARKSAAKKPTAKKTAVRRG